MAEATSTDGKVELKKVNEDGSCSSTSQEDEIRVSVSETEFYTCKRLMEEGLTIVYPSNMPHGMINTSMTIGQEERENENEDLLEHNCNTPQNQTDASNLQTEQVTDMQENKGPDEKTHTCEKCGKSYKKLSKLMVHYRSHTTGEKPFECEKCGKCFADSYYLKLHLGRHSGVKEFKCQQCGKCFLTYTNYKRHQETHSGVLGDRPQQAHSGDSGEDTFLDGSELQTEQATNIQYIKLLGEKAHTCEKCGKSYKNPSKLMVHSRAHSGEKPFECEKCGKCFASSYYLKTHFQRHSGVKEIECRQCGKCFLTYTNFKRHQETHSGVSEDRPQQAHSRDFDGVSFLDGSELQTEQATNMQVIKRAGGKAHTCEKCGKSYKKLSKLMVHYRSHTGEKPFECEKCGKCFAGSFYLKLHLRRHSGVKEFECQQCGKCFLTNTNFKRHQETHSRVSGEGTHQAHSEVLEVSFPDLAPYSPCSNPTQEDECM